MEDLRAKVGKMESDIHEIDINVAVLTSHFESLDRNVKALTDSVRALEKAINEQNGAVKLVRFMWIIFGAIMSASAMYVAWRNAK